MGLAQEGGEIVEKQGETHCFSILQSEDNFCFLLFENPLLQKFFGGYHLIQHFFVICQFPDELQD